MSVVIGCDSFLALRNVRNGHLGNLLQDQRVVVLVDPKQLDGSREAAPPGVEIDCLLDFDIRREPGLGPLSKRAYMARKSHTVPVTVWQDLKVSSYKHVHSRRRAVSLMWAGLRLAYFWAAGRLGKAQVWRRAVSQALAQHPITARYERMLADLDAQAVVSFSPEGIREMALIEAARKMGLPTAVMIRSLDNLSAKILHLPPADMYIVWANATRDFLLYMYPDISPDRVHVTGSPQFDRHLDPAFRLSREIFFEQIGLDSRRPLVVYTCATPQLIGHEIHITQHIADAVRDGKLANRAQLLVRGHPRGFGCNYPLLRETYPGVAVYPPPAPCVYGSPEHEAQVVRLILGDETVHLATLAYQDVQVNISGTMMVDSAILDKPIVGVHYDIPPDVPKGWSVRRFYRRSDIRPIIESGGVRLANNPEECIALINGYLKNPALDAEGRRKIRERECGPLDGRAGKRIAALLRGLVS